MPRHDPNPNPNHDIPWDYIAKLVCIGDSGTGKSSLTIRLCEGRFIPSHDVTIGVEFGSRIVPVGPPANAALAINDPSRAAEAAAPVQGDHLASRHAHTTSDQKKMKLSLWDTAGQETYKALTRSYFRGASGALLVFDISRRATFDSVTAWLNDLRHIAEADIVVVLVGNKSDLADDAADRRQVSGHEARSWCLAHQSAHNPITYLETSAKSGQGVERAFLETAERIYQNIEAGKYDLADRRSGVKAFTHTKSAAITANNPRPAGTIRLGLNDAVAGRRQSTARNASTVGGGGGGRCC